MPDAVDDMLPEESVTMQDVIGRFEADGFVGQFAAHERGAVHCYSCREDSPAAQMAVTAVRRLEGASDPADTMAIAALTCPRCAVQGTLVLGFGPDASLDDADVLTALPITAGKATASDGAS